MATQYKLVAVGGLALRYSAPPSGSDLWLKNNTKLGRSVLPPEGYRYPVEWGQISGNHCRIFLDNSQDPPQWYVEDSSTNGTFINDVRVPKFGRMPLNVGDQLRLSIPPNEVLEYVLRRDVGPPPNSGVQGSATKRKAVQGSEVSGPSGENRKRPRPSATGTGTVMDDSQAELLKQLSQLERTNAQLRSRLEVLHAQCSGHQQQVQQEQQRHQLALQELERKLEEGEKKNLETKAIVSEAAAAELNAARLRGDEAEAKVADLEAKLAAESDTRAKAERLNTALQVTVTDLKGALAEVEEQKRVLTSTTESLRSSIQSLQDDVQLLEGRLEEAAAEKQKLQEEASRLSQQLELEVRSAAAAKRVAETAEKELQAVHRELETERKARRHAADEVTAQQAQAAELKLRLECVEEKLVGKVDKMLVQRAHFKAIHTAHCHARELQTTLHRMMDAINQQLQEAISETDDVLTQPEHHVGVGMLEAGRHQLETQAMELQLPQLEHQRLGEATMTQPQDEPPAPYAQQPAATSPTPVDSTPLQAATAAHASRPALLGPSPHSVQAATSQQAATLLQGPTQLQLPTQLVEGSSPFIPSTYVVASMLFSPPAASAHLQGGPDPHSELPRVNGLPSSTPDSSALADSAHRSVRKNSMPVSGAQLAPVVRSNPPASSAPQHGAPADSAATAQNGTPVAGTPLHAASLNGTQPASGPTPPSESHSGQAAQPQIRISPAEPHLDSTIQGLLQGPLHGQAATPSDNCTVKAEEPQITEPAEGVSETGGQNHAQDRGQDCEVTSVPGSSSHGGARHQAPTNANQSSDTRSKLGGDGIGVGNTGRTEGTGGFAGGAEDGDETEEHSGRTGDTDSEPAGVASGANRGRPGGVFGVGVKDEKVLGGLRNFAGGSAGVFGFDEGQSSEGLGFARDGGSGPKTNMQLDVLMSTEDD